MTDLSNKPIIGVLALQGAVDLHKAHIEALGGEFRAVKTAEQIAGVDGLILPGGERTTMLKLIDMYGLWDGLLEALRTKPVWGICAGSILMAESVLNPAQKSFGILPMVIQRNGYGRQLASHYSTLEGCGDYEVAFIRAPVMEDIGDCEVLAAHDGQAVWVQKGRAMASTFHPEVNLSAPSPMHKHFFGLFN